MSLIAWAVMGLVVGSLAKFVLPGDRPRGFIVAAFLGVAGSLVGGFLATMLGYGGISGFNFWSFIISFLGTVAILGPWLLLTRSRPKPVLASHVEDLNRQAQ